VYGSSFIGRQFRQHSQKLAIVLSLRFMKDVDDIRRVLFGSGPCRLGCA
jgi:hypothetical protein